MCGAVTLPACPFHTAESPLGFDPLLAAVVGSRDRARVASRTRLAVRSGIQRRPILRFRIALISSTRALTRPRVSPPARRRRRTSSPSLATSALSRASAAAAASESIRHKSSGAVCANHKNINDAGTSRAEWPMRRVYRCTAEFPGVYFRK